MAGSQRQELEPSADSGIAVDSPNILEPTNPKFPGIHFVLGSPWHDSVTSKGNMVIWTEIGISFEIPEGAVPPEKQLNLTVWPCIKGPFILPPGYKLASPAFIIGPEFKFLKEIQLQMAHFVQLETPEDCQRMVFLSAPTTPCYNDKQQPEYHFRVSKKRGIFPLRQCVTTVTLDHFCVVAIGQKRKHDSGIS